MTTFTAIGQRGHYAIETLSQRTKVTIPLENFSYNNDKVVPAVILIRNYANDAPVVATCNNDYVIQIPSLTNYKLDVTKFYKILLYNQGRRDIDYMIVDRAGLLESDISLSFTESAANASLNDLLLHFNIDEITNDGIEEAFGITFATTKIGRMTSIAKFGIGCIKTIDADVSGLMATNGSFFEMSKNFCVDFWLYPAVSLSNAETILWFGTAASSYVKLQKSVSGAVHKFTLKVNGTTYTSSAFTDWTAAFKHIALTKQDITWRLFLDGIKILQFDNTFDDALDKLCVLGYSPEVSGAVATEGLPVGIYLDELRYTKVDHVWSENFTPPTSPYY